MNKPSDEDLYKAALAYRELNNCYRMGKCPSERLFTAIGKAGMTMDQMEAHLKQPKESEPSDHHPFKGDGT